MDVADNNDALVIAMLDNADQNTLESSYNNLLQPQSPTSQNETSVENEKHSAIWTTNSTCTLLKLYESKLAMLETPKKKTIIWKGISDSLKEHNIDMSPDQVRWKINALTKKYKQCIDCGQHDKFRYFKEMDNIYANYNVDCDSYAITELLLKKKTYRNKPQNAVQSSPAESKVMIELRKIRLANRIESDRNQGKIQLERQWLDYLRRKEEEKQYCADVFERNLKLKEEELELRKRNLEFKKTLEYKKIQLMEKEYEDILRIENDKCELLKQLFSL